MVRDLCTRERRANRLLVLDDHPLSRKSIVLAFSVRGFESIGVGTPDEALSSIDSFAPTVVILEWAFRDPHLRGLGLAHTLRRRSWLHGRRLAILVVSHAEQPPGFREREDVDAYFTKPVAPHVLGAAVTELAAWRQAQV